MHGLSHSSSKLSTTGNKYVAANSASHLLHILTAVDGNISSGNDRRCRNRVGHQLHHQCVKRRGAPIVRRSGDDRPGGAMATTCAERPLKTIKHVDLHACVTVPRS